MAKEEPISVAKFADMVGVTRQAIYKAIREGRIVDGLTDDRRVLPSIALEEYRGNTDPAKQLGRLRAESQALQESLKAGRGADAGMASGGGVDFNTAKKADMVYRAKIRELEYKEKLGKLVDREAVYRELFNMGKELRVAILAIPDRTIDDIMASSSRSEAHALLYRELVASLEGLADISKRLDR